MISGLKSILRKILENKKILMFKMRKGRIPEKKRTLPSSRHSRDVTKGKFYERSENTEGPTGSHASLLSRLGRVSGVTGQKNAS